jgi:lysine 2,3-aminomutase
MSLFNDSEPPSSYESNFRLKYFSNVTLSEWYNWKWQLQNSIKSYNDLNIVSENSLLKEEIDALLCDNKFPFSITPYYASLINFFDRDFPLRKMVIPTIYEQKFSEDESLDPLSEEHDRPVKCIVHRYPDRVLFLATDFCSSYCRYCTRSRLVGRDDECLSNYWEEGIKYIQSNKVIRDVLISGGDPLTLNDSKLYSLLYKLRAIDHVEIIRIGTKVPIVLPQRITKNFARMFKEFHPLWMNMHFTHPYEITNDVINACTILADAGIPLGSQTVLLKGINDNEIVLKNLFLKLIKMRVRPYYLYSCDKILGSSHFRVPIKIGIDIINKLRGNITGFAVPNFVIDLPNGGGKSHVIPSSIHHTEYDSTMSIKSYNGKLVYYRDN